MAKKTISCVVAIYNVEEYISKCIESLMYQDYSDIEIILVNDGSTDKSREICEHYCKIDDRIRLINQENAGANVARNTGLYAATGKWVYFVDGDDYVCRDVFSAIDKQLESSLDIIMFSNYVLKNGKENIQEYPINEIVFDTKEKFEELRLVTLDRFADSKYNYKTLDAISIWIKIYNRLFLLENGIEFIPKFPKLQDLSFNLLVYEKAKNAKFINHPGYVYRINMSSVSNRYQADFLKKFDIMSKWFKEYIERNDSSNALKNAYYRREMTLIRTSIVLYFCNKQNEKKYSERRNEFISLLEQTEMKEMIKKISFEGLPLQERVLSICIKNRWFFLCELLNLIREGICR